MNLLFERIKLQATFRRVYDQLPMDQADALISQAFERERAMTLRIHKQLQEQGKNSRVENAKIL